MDTPGNLDFDFQLYGTHSGADKSRVPRAASLRVASLDQSGPTRHYADEDCLDRRA